MWSFLQAVVVPQQVCSPAVVPNVLTAKRTRLTQKIDHFQRCNSPQSQKRASKFDHVPVGGGKEQQGCGAGGGVSTHRCDAPGDKLKESGWYGFYSSAFLAIYKTFTQLPPVGSNKWEVCAPTSNLIHKSFFKKVNASLIEQDRLLTTLSCY